MKVTDTMINAAEKIDTGITHFYNAALSLFAAAVCIWLARTLMGCAVDLLFNLAGSLFGKSAATISVEITNADTPTPPQ